MYMHTFFLWSLGALGRPRLHLLGRLEYDCALFHWAVFLYLSFIFLAKMEDVLEGRKSNPQSTGAMLLTVCSNCVVSLRTSSSFAGSIRLYDRLSKFFSDTRICCWRVLTVGGYKCGHKTTLHYDKHVHLWLVYRYSYINITCSIYLRWQFLGDFLQIIWKQVSTTLLWWIADCWFSGIGEDHIITAEVRTCQITLWEGTPAPPSLSHENEKKVFTWDIVPCPVLASTARFSCYTSKVYSIGVTWFATNGKKLHFDCQCLWYPVPKMFFLLSLPFPNSVL